MIYVTQTLKYQCCDFFSSSQKFSNEKIGRFILTKSHWQSKKLANVINILQ
jgi:hypothetical protein